MLVIVPASALIAYGHLPPRCRRERTVVCAMFSSYLAQVSADSSMVDPAVKESVSRLELAWSRHGGRPGNVADAVLFAIRSHRGQRRESGELYASHPLAVAAIVASWGFDEVSVSAACCHDVLEDCDVSLDELAARIGPESASVVDGVTKVGLLNLAPGDTVESASMTKFLAAVVSDVRVLAVKIADRLHNLRTITALSPERQLRSATEALEVFAPLAHRLGLEDPRREMEDLAFAIVDPKACSELRSALDRTAVDRRRIESSAASDISELLTSSSLTAEVESRTKHLYSIYRKQRATGLALDSLHDLVGVRVVVESREDCYSALGVVHANYTPVPGRFKDYVALPRPSGYQSLHTTILCDGVEVEVQIRSKEMHAQACYGVAAHYLYKMSKDKNRTQPGDSSLAADLASAASPEAFLERLREELAPRDEVVVLTPKGRPISLPSEATILDFAYKIHTDVGHRCTGARVNGSLVPFRSTLRTGDVVEILTGSKPSPSRDWLQLVKTSRAREKIRKFLDNENPDPYGDGRAALQDELRQRGSGHLIDDSLFLARLAAANGFPDQAALCKALSSDFQIARLQGLPVRAPIRRTKVSPHSSFEVQVRESLGGLPCSFPRCCNPRSLTAVSGIVSRTHEVSVHSSDCASLTATVRDLPAGEFSRLIPVLEGSAWWLEVRASDRPGLLRDVSSVLFSLGIDVAWSQVSNTDEAVLRFRFSALLYSPSSVRSHIASIDGVVSVQLA